MNKLLLILSIFILHPFATQSEVKHAFCKVPVTDVVSCNLGAPNDTYEQVKNAYAQLPISWGSDVKDKAACPRVYQLLKHEIVSIINETAYEAQVLVPSCIRIIDSGSVTPLIGWVLKDSLCNVHEDCIRYLPRPILADQLDPSAYYGIISIASPFIDSDNNFYAAGTRFAISKETENHYIVFTFDEKRRTIKTLHINKDICYDASQPLSQYEMRTYFCKLISLWASVPHGVVPLVWGGASVGKVWSADDYSASTRQGSDGQEYAVWDRPKYGNQTYLGVDASNVIIRVAHIIGIPYFCKNSKTAAYMLEEVAMYEWPQNGDLIWIPDALLVISNLEKNTIVCAMSYTAGYGCLIELPLSQVFKDINTYDDLMQAHRLGDSLTILDANGNEYRNVNDFKILKLFSYAHHE